MARKGVFPIVATLAVVGVVLAVFSQTVMRDSNISTNTMTTEQAYADLSGKMKRIGVQEVSVNPQQLDVSEFLDAKDELPDIDSSYPFVVEGNGDVNIEIFRRESSRVRFRFFPDQHGKEVQYPAQQDFRRQDHERISALHSVRNGG